MIIVNTFIVLSFKLNIFSIILRFIVIIFKITMTKCKKKGRTEDL